VQKLLMYGIADSVDFDSNASPTVRVTYNRSLNLNDLLKFSSSGFLACTVFVPDSIYYRIEIASPLLLDCHYAFDSATINQYALNISTVELSAIVNVLTGYRINRDLYEN